MDGSKDVIPEPVTCFEGQEDVEIKPDNETTVSFSHALHVLSEIKHDDEDSKIEIMPDGGMLSMKCKLPEPKQVLICLFQPDSQIDLCPIEDLKEIANDDLNYSAQVSSAEKSAVYFGSWSGFLSKLHAEAVLSCDKWVLCVIGLNGDIAMYADVLLAYDWEPEENTIGFELSHNGQVLSHRLRQLQHASTKLNQTLGLIKDENANSKETASEATKGSTDFTIKTKTGDDAGREECTDSELFESVFGKLDEGGSETEKIAKSEFNCEERMKNRSEVVHHLKDDCPVVQGRRGKAPDAPCRPYGRSYSCGVCGRIFRRICSLRQHEKTHNEVKDCPLDESEDGADESDKKAQSEDEGMSGGLDDDVREDSNEAVEETTDRDGNYKEIRTAVKLQKGGRPCDACGKYFTNKMVLRKHIQTHKTEWPNMCPYCSKLFKEQTEVEQHKLEACPLLHTCDVCGKRYSNLNHHRQIHNELRKQFECNICGKRVFRADTLAAHKLRVHHEGENNNKDEWLSGGLDDDVREDLNEAMEETTDRDGNDKEHKIRTAYKPRKGGRPCDACGKYFTNKIVLRKHIQTHKNKWPNMCPYCSKLFKEQTEVEQHKLEACPLLRPCKVCGKRYTKIGNHMRLMHNESRKQFECNICGKKFFNPDRLAHHKFRIHHEGEKVCSCEICGKAFLFNHHLKAHMREHKHTTVQCHLCGHEAHNDGRLKRHILSHSEEKKHTCQLCGKKFTRSDGLLRHMWKHRGEDGRNFNCTQCGENFTSQYRLNQHKRKFHGKTPTHVCSVCGKAFFIKDCLKIHLNTHTGERPYVCDVCGKSFSQPAARHRHRMIHTGEQRYSCELCGMKFNQSCSVTRHMKTHEKKS